MIGTVQNVRMYLPAEDEEKPNERNTMHPETNSTQVLMNAEGINLDEFLGPQIIISSDKPQRTGVLWGEITATRIE